MGFCMSKHFSFLLLQILVGFLNLASCQPNFVLKSCSGGKYSKNSVYQKNLNTIFSPLPTGVDDYGYNSSSFGQNPDMVNTIVMCRGDVKIATCRDCVRNATIKIKQSCPNDKEAVGWYDQCMIRYSNESIHGKLREYPKFIAYNINNVSSKDQFNNDLRTLLNGLRVNASGSGDRRKYAASSMNGPDVLTIYGYMQCLPDLTKEDCNSCLIGATNDISRYFSGKEGGRVYTPSCNLRYEIYPIIDCTPPPPSFAEGTPSLVKGIGEFVG